MRASVIAAWFGAARHPHEVLARRLRGAIEARDDPAVIACFAPDARIWHRMDVVDAPGHSREENAAMLAWAGQYQRRLSYHVCSLDPNADGFVLSHILTAQTTLGAVSSLPMAMWVTVGDGALERQETYFDASNLAPLLAAGEAGRG